MENLAQLLTGRPETWLQAIAIALCLFAAWISSRLASPKIKAEDARRLVFPLSALAYTLIGKAVLKYPHHATNLLDIATQMLIALAVIRVLVYMLQTIFTQKAWIQSIERAIAWLIWIVLALHISGLSQDIVESLDEISFSFGKERISVLLVMQALVVVATSFLVSLWASRAIEKRIMGTDLMDMNLRVMLSKVTRTLFIVIAAIASLSAAGIDMTALSMFGGALGVGLGLGLQKIASNYVSGFIILLDRSIHINDIVSIEDKMGVLTKLTTRYVVLKSADGSEALIPNDTLITSTVVNHTYTDRQVRIAAPVQVGYGSDLELAMKIMVNAAKKQPRVLASPEPQVFLRSFADSGIDLELGFWIGDLEEGRFGLISDINLEIWREFKKNGIEIPFPQREVRLLGPQQISHSDTD